jgi:hypothetical protein
MNRWREIDTAPRDSTAILVMSDNWPGLPGGRAAECNGHNTYVAAWWTDDGGGNGEWVCYMNTPSDQICPIDPTHWMPLPPPPKTLEAQAQQAATAAGGSE